MGDFEKKVPSSAFRKKKIAYCITNGVKKFLHSKKENILQSIERRKKYPAHQVSRKRFLADQKPSISPLPPQKLKCWLLNLVFM